MLRVKVGSCVGLKVGCNYMCVAGKDRVLCKANIKCVAGKDRVLCKANIMCILNVCCG